MGCGKNDQRVIIASSLLEVRHQGANLRIHTGNGSGIKRERVTEILHLIEPREQVVFGDANELLQIGEPTEQFGGGPAILGACSDGLFLQPTHELIEGFASPSLSSESL